MDLNKNPSQNIGFYKSQKLGSEFSVEKAGSPADN